MLNSMKMMERKVSGNSISSLIGERLPFCSGCNKLIKEQYLLEAVEKFWHESCLLCSCCKGRLAEMSTTFYAKADLLLCKRDYFRLFGRTGICSACHKDIPSFELVMRARGNSYHLECFACQLCAQRFCVGDHFYLHEDKILCEEDYKEVTNPRHHGLDHLTNPLIPSNCLNFNSNSSNSTSNKKNDQPIGHSGHPTHQQSHQPQPTRLYSCSDH